MKRRRLLEEGALALILAAAAIDGDGEETFVDFVSLGVWWPFFPQNILLCSCTLCTVVLGLWANCSLQKQTDVLRW